MRPADPISTSEVQYPPGTGRSRRLGLLPLICLIYLVVSGGAYGVEDAVRIAGARLTLLLCALIPLTLSLPTALMAAELTDLIPVEGGFYFWVKEGLGSFAGFLEAYLTLLFTAVDTAIYPVLFATYLAYLVPIGAAGQTVIAIVLIWSAGMLNLAGIKPVGHASIVFTLALTVPFALVVLIGLPHLLHWRPPQQPLIGADFMGALGGGLTVVMWNFSGWENISVLSGEIAHPGRNYLRAIIVALPLVALGYLLPLAVFTSGIASTARWHAGSFAQAGAILGGRFLGVAISVGGAISAFAMFSAALLWVSRLPYILAGEGYLPLRLAQLWQAREVPARSIVTCCAVFTLLVPLGFITLVVLDVLFYMMGLTLEMAALVRLRRFRPDRRGLFTIGGGRGRLYLVVAAPLATWLLTFGFALGQGGRQNDLIVAIIALIAAWPIYRWLRSRFGGPDAVGAIAG